MSITCTSDNTGTTVGTVDPATATREIFAALAETGASVKPYGSHGIEIAHASGNTSLYEADTNRVSRKIIGVWLTLWSAVFPTAISTARVVEDLHVALRVSQTLATRNRGRMIHTVAITWRQRCSGDPATLEQLLTLMDGSVYQEPVAA